MAYTTLISTEELTAHLDDPAWAVVDCRFQLKDTEFGRRAYERAHIPGALYAHLDRDLSGPILPGKTGRHPLPAVEALAEKLSAWGINADVQVVAYDAVGGALAAARLWWLLRWLGHGSVAVLDSGWLAWHREGRPVRSGVERVRRGSSSRGSGRSWCSRRRTCSASSARRTSACSTPAPPTAIAVKTRLSTR